MSNQETNTRIARAMPGLGRRRILWSFMDANHIRQVAPEVGATFDPSEREAFLQKHAAAAQRAADLPPRSLIPQHPAILDEHEQSWIEKVSQTPLFRQVFGMQRLSFGKLPIESLTTYQPFLDPLHVPVPETDREILEWCLPLDFQTSGAVGAAPGRDGLPRVILSTDDPGSQLAVDVGPDGVKLALRPRANWVQVVAVEGRYVLRNGYHRAVALAAAGATHIAAIIVEAPALEMVVPPEPCWFAAQYLRSTGRPPFVGDFLEPDLTLEFDRVRQRRVVEVRLDVAEFMVPLERVDAAQPRTATR
jgi:hypothetical protein